MEDASSAMRSYHVYTPDHGVHGTGPAMFEIRDGMLLVTDEKFIVRQVFAQGEWSLIKIID